MRHRIKKNYSVRERDVSRIENKRKLSNYLLHKNRSTCFYQTLKSPSSMRSAIPLAGISLALLLVMGIIMFPSLSIAEKASAATTVPDPNFSIQLSMGETLNTTEELESGVVGYISNNFTVSTTSTSSYSIYLSPDTTAGYTNKLIGRDHKQEILGVGSNVSASNFANNTWGYGLSNTNDTTVQNNALTYSTIPDGSTPIKTINNPDDGNDTYKLVFAAKINNEKPVDHYQSQAVLSVMASPKDVVLKDLSDITNMQEMTSEICANTSENISKKLIDDRDTSKKYTVTKLKGDVGCWMTENMDYATGRMYHDNTYGGYYNYTNAKEVCNFTGWQLPTKDQYQALLDAYGIKDDAAGSTTLRSAPLNFLYGGRSIGGSPSYTGNGGNYWSSTPNGDTAYYLYFNSSSAALGGNLNQPYGLSVRCVVKK